MSELLDGLVLQFPARPGYLAISRLNATTLAAGAGFDVEALDDLRLAIDEAVTWLVADPYDDDRIELDIRCRTGRFEVRGTRTTADAAARPAPDTPGDLDDLVNAIFGATVDEFRVGIDDSGRRYIDLIKVVGGPS